MPIQPTAEFRRISQETFREIDYKVMGAAFAAHNEMGRLFDETYYAAHMEAQLLALKLNVQREYKISLTCEDFKKDYYVDLLVENSIPYELKVAEAFNDKHRAQALNYLYLCGVPHGKLINFRKPSVEAEFVSTSLERADRQKYTLSENDWTECSEPWISSTLERLLEEWGTRLSLEVYKEGFAHFCCSEYLSKQSLPIKKGPCRNGEIFLNRIDENSFLYLTAASKYLQDHEKHLSKLLELPQQRQAQWINFDKSHITLRSVFL